MGDIVTRFKRVSRANVLKVHTSDEEKVTVTEDIRSSSISPSDAAAAPRMTNVFSWSNINYVVPIPGKPDRQLLADVSGYVVPGKLTVLMGESGAGKTTLLNVLSMRTDTGVVTGNRFINGQPLPSDFQSQTCIFPFNFGVDLQLNSHSWLSSAYCQQMDTHAPFSTVREALLFSAKLRQPPSVPLAEKEA